MQKRAVVVCAAAAVLGLAAAILGLAAEHFKNKAFVRADKFQCVYRRTPALACGILAAVLSLAAATLVTAASGCFGCCGGTGLPADRRRSRTCCATFAWVLVAEAVASFLYGAARNAGGTGGFTTIRRRNGGTTDIVCDELRDWVFVSASVAAAIGIACAITAYVVALQQRNRPRAATLAVAMGQLNNPTPVAYPAQPVGHGDKQPGETTA